MSKPLVRIKLRDWDWVTPVLLGDVKSEEVDVVGIRVPKLIDNVAADPDCEAAEMSLSRYNIQVAKCGGIPGVVAVPFLMMRGFRTRNIVVPEDSPLTSISELKGKRIGLSGWQDSGNTWTKALLRREGVEVSNCRWVVTRCTADDAIDPNRACGFDDGKLVVHDPNEKPLVDMLHEGEIDAMLQAFMPKGYFEGELGLRPLVRDFKAHEAAYFKETGYVPGIHILTFKASFVEAHPEAPAAVCRLLDEAKKLWKAKRRRYADTSAWIIQDLLDEAHLLGEGADPWGLEPNRRMFDDFCREAFEQKLTPRLTNADMLFPEKFE